MFYDMVGTHNQLQKYDWETIASVWIEIAETWDKTYISPLDVMNKKEFLNNLGEKLGISSCDDCPRAHTSTHSD